MMIHLRAQVRSKKNNLPHSLHSQSHTSGVHIGVAVVEGSFDTNNTMRCSVTLKHCIYLDPGTAMKSCILAGCRVTGAI